MQNPCLFPGQPACSSSRPVAFRLLPAALLAAGLAACTSTPAPVVQTPALPPPPPPPPVSVTLPTPSFDNWMDAPQTAGDWRYAPDPAKPYAVFGARGGAGLFALECDARAGRIALVRGGAAASGPVAMQIRTETADRVLQASPVAGAQRVSATLNARDPLLDAMAFSKGRFAVEVAGLPALYLPSWAEVSRVIEDCR